MDIDHQEMVNVNIMEIDDHEEEDRISQLPDSVLAHIVSNMNTREAVRTSVVSSRWRNFYKYPLSITLDAHNILDTDKYSDINVSQMHCLERIIVKMKRTVEFMTFVCEYLESVTEAQRIETLKVQFTFGNKYDFALKEWIEFALNRHVEEIDLCLMEDNFFSAPYDGKLFKFPCDLLLQTLSLKRLRLAYCELGPQWSIFSGFSTLTTLELMNVDLVSDGHFQNLIKNCHDIESLSLYMCWNLRCLKIEHPFCQRLRYLNVNDCPQLEKIELKGLNVETLEYRGKFVWLHFHNTPMLRTVFTCMKGWRTIYTDIEPFSMLPVDLPHLQTLLLESTYHVAGTMCIPRSINLRHLIILKLPKHERSISWMASVLKDFPRLQKLELHLGKDSDVEEELKDRNWPPRCPHGQLKQVLISGMRGQTSEVDIAKYILINATSLQLMEISPHPMVYLGNGKWHQLEPYEIWARTGRNKVEHHLRQHVGAQVHLSIL